MTPFLHILQVKMSFHIVILILLQSSVGAINDEGNEVRRGGDIVPEIVSDVPVEIAPDPDLFGEPTYYDDEGSGSGDECWDECHPLSRADDSGNCVHCPQIENPSTWRVKEFMAKSLQCDVESPKINFNLSRYLDINWIGNSWSVEISYKQFGEAEESMKRLQINSLNETEAELQGLCSGVKYNVCLDLFRGGVTQTGDCEECTASGVPPYNPTKVHITGFSYMDVEWETVELQCSDIRYQILVNDEIKLEINNQDATDMPHRISNIAPGNHTVTVLTINNDGVSSGSNTSVPYQTYPITPPIIKGVEKKVIDGHLMSEITWESSMDVLPNDDTPKGYILTLYNTTNISEENKEIHIDISETNYRLNVSEGWNTEFSMKTYVGNISSSKSGKQPLFHHYQLLQLDDNVDTNYEVVDGELIAVLHWSYIMGKEFKGMNVKVHLKDSSGRNQDEEEVSWPNKSIRLRLGDKIDWNTVVSLQPVVFEKIGDEMDGWKLFGGKILSRPKESSVKVKHYITKDVLIANVSWHNSIDQEFKGLETVVEIKDRNPDQVLRSESIAYPQSWITIKLDGEDSWPWEVSLHTAVRNVIKEGDEGEEQEEWTGRGDATNNFPLFSNITLSAPENTSLDHQVQGRTLMATINWDDALDIGTFKGLSTLVKLYTDEGIFFDSHMVTHPETNFTISHQEPLAIKFGTLYSLKTCIGDNRCGEESRKDSLFPLTILSPPTNITYTHGYDATQQSVYALMSWENTIEKEFNDLITVINVRIPSQIRRKRETGRPIYQFFNQTQRQFYLSDFEDPATEFSLQTAMGNESEDCMGEESEVIVLFGDSLKLSHPEDILVSTKVVDGKLISDIQWTPSPLFPPTKINIYGSEGNLIKTIPMHEKEENKSIARDADVPSDATFSISVNYTPEKPKVSPVQALFPIEQIGIMNGQTGLSPPLIHNITVLPSTSSSSLARIDWNHTMELFEGLVTVVTVWREDGSEYNHTEVQKNNTVVVEVEEEAVFGATVTLQSKFGENLSHKSQSQLLFEESGLVKGSLMWILMVLVLTTLLILYILFTVICLRRLCGRSGNLDVRRQKRSEADADPGTPGVYSPGKFHQNIPLMEEHNLRNPVPSDDGSFNTDQSLMSEENLDPLCSTPLPPSLLYPGDSMITLNKFNEEDDGFFLGGFDEDGSFIGDYMETDQETNRAVMNKLLGFHQLLSKKF